MTNLLRFITFLDNSACVIFNTQIIVCSNIQHSDTYICSFCVNIESIIQDPKPFSFIFHQVIIACVQCVINVCL